MKKIYFAMIVGIFAFAKANSQIVINELDSDNPSTDFEEFVELKTDTPFQSLDGYIMVLFNGSTSFTTGRGRSYYVENLSGLVSDSNGLVVIGASKVVPAVDRLLANDGNTIQNGADGVAIYQGTPDDFPDRTFATTANLVDALVYGRTTDERASQLLDLLGETIQYIEGPANNTNSLQLKNDGTYESKAPTPFSLNDATETSYIGLDFVLNPTGDLNEGDTFTLNFSLTKPATQDLSIPFALNYQGFTTDDYIGANTIEIATGNSSQTLNYSIVNDIEDEGDEFVRVNIGNMLPPGYKRLRDNIRYLVIDDDFTMAAHGNPDNPTYNQVTSTAPADYYQSLNNKTGAELQEAITAIIADPNVVRHHTYGDITTILKEADASALNSNKVWLLYSETERRDVQFEKENNFEDEWNREHVFPRSRGGYESLREKDELPDGINVWVTTNVDSLRHGNSDAHHLRATDTGLNSSRGSKNYGAVTTTTQYAGPDGNKGSWHGDVARSIFYMTQRYNYSMDQMLAVIDGTPAIRLGQIGDLATLLQWHQQDPPDDFEMNRNNVIYEWQRNRNPFIDLPQLADYIWGDRTGQPFTLSTETANLDELRFFPNPSINALFIANVKEPTTIEIFDALGRMALSQKITENTRIDHELATGIYYARLNTASESITKKFLVQ